MNHNVLERVIDVNGVKVRFRASALIPRLYRVKFGRDVIADLSRLQKNMKAVAEDETGELSLGLMDLTIFENISYMLAKHADPSIPEDPDDWLESLPGVFSIYAVLPEIMDLWGMSQATTSVPAKK